MSQTSDWLIFSDKQVTYEEALILLNESNRLLSSEKHWRLPTREELQSLAKSFREHGIPFKGSVYWCLPSPGYKAEGIIVSTGTSKEFDPASQTLCLIFVK